MPNVTIYIRKEDIDAWQTIENKSEWLHGQLSGVQSSGVTLGSGRLPEEASSSLVPRNDEFVPKPPDPEYGYGCCVGRAPCKHWVFDDVNSIWKNALTGKTRDVV